MSPVSALPDCQNCTPDFEEVVHKRPKVEDEAIQTLRETMDRLGRDHSSPAPAPSPSLPQETPEPRSVPRRSRGERERDSPRAHVWEMTHVHQLPLFAWHRQGGALLADPAQDLSSSVFGTGGMTLLPRCVECGVLRDDDAMFSIFSPPVFRAAGGGSLGRVSEKGGSVCQAATGAPPIAECAAFREGFTATSTRFSGRASTCAGSPRVCPFRFLLLPRHVEGRLFPPHTPLSRYCFFSVRRPCVLPPSPSHTTLCSGASGLPDRFSVVDAVQEAEPANVAQASSSDAPQAPSRFPEESSEVGW